MARNTASVAICRNALCDAFIRVNPGLPLDDNGYVSHFSQNLIAGVTPADFEADLRAGDGNELDGKFRAVRSSAALAVNTFAPFKRQPALLSLAGIDGFTRFQFEEKCWHGLAGRRAPNLDALAEGTQGIVGVESKCLEYLTPHVAKFAPAYEEGIVDYRRATPWFAEMLRLQTAPETYRCLDAAQLIKHAFGLMHCFKDRPRHLLYLYWEPQAAEMHAIFRQHRAEIAAFADAVRGNDLTFHAMSYRELWQSWSAATEPHWLPGHLARLKARYDVVLPTMAGLAITT